MPDPAHIHSIDPMQFGLDPSRILHRLKNEAGEVIGLWKSVEGLKRRALFTGMRFDMTVAQHNLIEPAPKSDFFGHFTCHRNETKGPSRSVRAVCVPSTRHTSGVSSLKTRVFLSNVASQSAIEANVCGFRVSEHARTGLFYRLKRAISIGSLRGGPAAGFARSNRATFIHEAGKCGGMYARGKCATDVAPPGIQPARICHGRDTKRKGRTTWQGNASRRRPANCFGGLNAGAVPSSSRRRRMNGARDAAGPTSAIRENASRDDARIG